MCGAFQFHLLLLTDDEMCVKYINFTFFLLKNYEVWIRQILLLLLPSFSLSSYYRHSAIRTQVPSVVEVSYVLIHTRGRTRYMEAQTIQKTLKSENDMENQFGHTSIPLVGSEPITRVRSYTDPLTS